ncbi:MAG: UbiA-like polyprenyltransferase [Gaiellaceae bacterium]
MSSLAEPGVGRRFLSLVKFEHTVFALPFAYVAALLSQRKGGELPSWHDIVWITVAMIGARSLAMGLNRLIDRELDARNPRTASRELPSGLLSPLQVVLFCLASLALFVVAAFQLDPIVRMLWPIPVAVFVVYPYLKRFTWLCHLWLGAADGLAPLGAWLAIRGSVSLAAVALSLAVACWVAGFDLFYALLDREIDVAQGLHSVATRFGVGGAFLGARALHLMTVALLAVAGIAAGAGALYWAGIGVVALLLAYEHGIVSPGDLRRLDAAFFAVNGIISVMLLTFTLADALA